MFHRPFIGLCAVALALGLAARADAGGYILDRDGNRTELAPATAYDDPIIPLYAFAENHVGLVKGVDDYAALYVPHTTVYIDPNKPYAARQLYARHPGRLDHNHSLVRAQRAYHALHAPKGQVIRRVDPQRNGDQRQIRPVMIIYKPDALDRRREQPGPKATPPMPNVPRHEQPDGDAREVGNLMAAAD